MRKACWVALTADVSKPVSRLLASFVGVFRGKSDIKALPPRGSPTAAGANALTRQVIRNFVEFAVDVIFPGRGERSARPSAAAS